MNPEELVIASESLIAAVKGENYRLDLSTASTRFKYLGKSFVTITKSGELRGCIGSLVATESLGLDIATNSRKAALSDPRFSPVPFSELSELEIEVSVLSDPDELFVESYEKLVQMLRPGSDGVVVRDRDRRATFLPAVWEKIPDTEQFLEALWHKAGLTSRHWSQSTCIDIYSAEVIGPVRLTEL